MDMTLSNGSQETVNRWRQRGVLLNFHEDLLELCEEDSSQGYPFLRDNDLDPVVQLHEHERFGNLNYATQMKIWSAYVRLGRIIEQVAPENRQIASYLNKPLPRILYIGEDLEISAFFADLVSALDAETGQILLIYGYPIKLRMAGWRKLADLLSGMSSPWNTVTKGDQVYSVMPSAGLVNIVLENGSLPDWIETVIDYRNNFTHRTFFATIIDNDGFFLPRDASILPSSVLNRIETVRDTGSPDDLTRVKRELFNPLPLHEYCQDTYEKVRNLIEQVYEQIVQTYRARLNNPPVIENPHGLYRLGV